MGKLKYSIIWKSLFAIFIFSSCGGHLTEDLTKIPEFHSTNFSVNPAIIDQKVDLYIDYSTCVAEAINSPYYQAVHPVIVDCSPTFFSIKGKAIQEETSDRQKVYELLRSVREVNNAEIKDAIGQIVSNNNQAVLITDCEYYMPGITGDNLNNPYLAEHFRTWLKKGYDIYIYSEPYLESQKYNKFRYYIIFTDDKLDNNIQQRFQRSAPDAENVKMFHLSNSIPTVLFAAEEYPQVNPCLSFNSESYLRGSNFECQEYQTDWNDMYKYILEDAYDAMGNQLKNGDYILKGIYLENNPSDCYEIQEIIPEVYHVYEPYQEMMDSINTGGTIKQPGRLEKADKIFVVDQDAFQSTKEIILRMNPNFDGSTLKTDIPNLLKVDLVLKKAKENFSQNSTINDNFKWVSISSRNDGKFNTSLYQSVNQLLLDPTLNPANKENPVIYSIYISTFSK